MWWTLRAHRAAAGRDGERSKPERVPLALRLPPTLVFCRNRSYLYTGMPVPVELAVVMKGGGMAVLRVGLKQVTIYVREDVYEALRGKAFVERTSMNQLIGTAIVAFLRRSPPPRLIAETPRSRPAGRPRPRANRAPRQ